MTGAVTLSADSAPGSISFDTNATSFSLGSLGGNTITTVNAGSISILSTLTTAGQTFTVNAPLVLAPESATTAGSFTLQNDSPEATTVLDIAGGIAGGTTSSTLTLMLSGSNTGANLISGIISDGGASSLSVEKTGSGTWTLSAANSFTGGTSIAGGRLVLSGGDDRLATTGTLSFTGTESSTFDIGSTSQSLAGLNFQTTGLSSVNTISGAGGTLTVTGGNIQIGGGDSTSASNAQSVDMTGLGTFIYDRSSGTFAVGGTTNFASAGTTGSGTLSMAGVNTITAASFNVGYYSTGSNSLNSGTAHLGQTNTINASTIVVGNVKTFATLDFRNLIDPTLTIRGTTGGSSRASILVSTANSGLTDSVGTVDLTSGGTVNSTLDAMVSTLTIGQNIRNSTSLGKTSTGTFIMGLGTLDVTTIILGQQTSLSGSNTRSGVANATLSLNGGTIIAATFTLADKRASTAAEAINSTFNLFSGTLSATTIQRGAVGTGAGADTATINFNWVDGTISNIDGSDQTVTGSTAVNGLTGGLSIALNNTGNVSGTHTWNVSGTQTATVQNTVTLTGDGSLTKTGTGTLAFLGGNSYAGITTVSEGLLIFGGTASLYNGATSNWTNTNLVVESGAVAGFNVGGAGEFTTADVDLLTSLGTAAGGFKSGSFIALDTTNAVGGIFTYDSVIGDTNNRQNSLGLVKLGSGTLELTRVNTYTGGTIIDAGTLALSGGDNRLLGTGSVAFSGGSGTLDVGSTSQTLTGLTFLTTGTGSHVITGAGGSLRLNSGNIQIGSGDATSSGSETVDMSGLGAFTYDNASGNFHVGGLTNSSSTSITGNGILILAATNTITAANFKINPFGTGLSSLNTGTVHLGQTNTINATTILIGEQKTIALLDFQSGLVNPTLKIRGTGATDADRATITVGYNGSGILVSDSTVDLVTGVTGSSILDAKVSTLLIGQIVRNGTPGRAVTGTFLMGMGMLDATTIILGQQNSVSGTNSSSQATATLSLSGGTINVTTFTLADKKSGAAAQTISSNFNLNSGTLNATTIQRGTAGTGAGADTATINFNWVDGTIGNIAGVDQTVSGNTAVNGLTGGLNIVLNNTGNTSGTHTWNVSGDLTGTQTATIQSTAILSGVGGLTKTGKGTLIFEGANLYSGMTTVAEGELHLNTSGGQAVAGDVTVAGGTLRLLQADQISTVSGIFVSEGVFDLQGFNQTLASVQLTGGDITGSTGILTSTSAFDLQAGVISAILGGTAGVVKSTAGVVTLSGVNVFTGGTLVNAGTLIGTSSAALGSNSGLSVASGATFAYRPATGGSFNLGSGAITLVGGSTIGGALGGTLSQSVIQSSGAASASGSIKVDVFIASGGSVAFGTHNLFTTSGGLTSGGASYALGGLYNATNFTVSNLTATDTTVSIDVATATALTSAYWKGGLGVGNNVWALSDGTASNWVTNSNGSGSTPLVPGAAATVNFSATGATNQSAMVLGASMSIRNLIVSDAGGITLNDDGNSLTIVNSSGVRLNSGAGAVTLNAPIVLGVSQTWTNNSTNALNVTSAVSGSASLTKSGTGALNLSGANTFTGTLSITAGMVNLLAGGTINGTNAAFSVGSGTGSVGAFIQSGGDIFFNGNFNLGVNGSSSAGSYGFYSMSGGTVADTGSSSVRFRMGGGASYSTGVFYQSGGAITIIFGNGLEVGANASTNLFNATGIAYLTGGTFTAASNRIGYNGTSSNANGIRGEQTVAENALITINGTTFLGLAANDVGVLNLNGGVYATQRIVKTNGTGIVNFDGGILKAATSANSGSFFTGLTSANVFSGGLTVDTNGQSITIGQSLLAPSGNGIVSVAVTDGGSGYVGAPYISISGDGTGATAVANMVDDGTGNGTFKIGSITITSAGTDYTGTPIVTLTGGGGTGVVLGSVALAANTSGGITQTGAGTLTLSGTNTYTGATVVDVGGTLIAGNVSAFGVNSAATVNGTLRMAGRDIALGSLAGSGIVENASSTSSTLTTGGNEGSTTFDGIIRDGSGAGTLSFVKVGAGTQTLAADNTYTGTTLVSEGTLQIGQDGVGSISGGSAVTVNGSTAALAGSGIVAGSATLTSGSLRPGDAGGSAVGNLTLGSLDLTAGGIAALQIEGSHSYDSIAIITNDGLTLNGNLVITTSLSGASLDAVFADGATFDLLDWSGVVGGTFDVGTNLRDGSADTGLQFDLPDISSLARFWDVSSFLTTGSITVVVPEPGRAILFFSALLSMGLRRRRNWG
ncbi:MAG: autotransporter-associated beta strand repeat-containing protein [Prosthecobacter sp.]